MEHDYPVLPRRRDDIQNIIFPTIVRIQAGLSWQPNCFPIRLKALLVSVFYVLYSARYIAGPRDMLSGIYVQTLLNIVTLSLEGALLM
jgi:hypothetical protein